MLATQTFVEISLICSAPTVPPLPLFWRPAFLAKGQTLLALLLALTMSVARMLMALDAASGFCGMLATSTLTFSL